MKTLFKLLTILLVPLASCVTPQYTGVYNDDVYSFGAKSQDMTPVVVVNEPVNPMNAPQPQPNVVNEEQDSTYGEALIDDNYYYEDNFKYDDYYDYSYSSRIRRFDNPLYGAGYYDSYYTNMYWYDYNPYAWGTSIYIGYDYRYPSYYSNFYSPFSSWPYYSPYYAYNNYWYSSYYNPYYGYNYWNPYYGNSFYNGYWTGYYTGYNYGTNPYDINSRYYGHREGAANMGRSRSSISSNNYKRPANGSISTNRSSGNMGSRVESSRSAKSSSDNRGYFSSSRQASGIKTDRNSSSLNAQNRSTTQSRTVNVGNSSSRISTENRQNIYNKANSTNTSGSRYTLIAHKQIQIQVQGIKAHGLPTPVIPRLETQTVVVHINTIRLQIQILNRAVSFRLPAPQAIDISVLPQQPTVQQGRATLIHQAGLLQHIGIQIHRAEQLADRQLQNL